MNIKPYIITPALFLFRAINYSYACCNHLRSFKKKLNTSLSLLIDEQICIFLNDSIYPYDSTYNIENFSLIYNIDKKIFYNKTSLLYFEIGISVPIPILSLEIVNKNGIVVHDLTDFIEPMRYMKTSETYTKPSIGHIISVWQLCSKTILDENELIVQYINNEGDMIVSNLRNNISLY
jgi:hypothetical protein